MIALVVSILGTLLFLVSVLADAIGIGVSQMFGWKQITGTVVGLIAAVGGLWYYRRLTR